MVQSNDFVGSHFAKNVTRRYSTVVETKLLFFASIITRQLGNRDAFIAPIPLLTSFKAIWW